MEGDPGKPDDGGDLVMEVFFGPVLVGILFGDLIKSLPIAV